jgi:DNA-binding Xre family transcriptional regulator
MTIVNGGDGRTKTVTARTLGASCQALKVQLGNSISHAPINEDIVTTRSGSEVIVAQVRISS